MSEAGWEEGDRENKSPRRRYGLSRTDERKRRAGMVRGIELQAKKPRKGMRQS